MKRDYSDIVKDCFSIENKTTKAYVEDGVGLLGPVDFHRDDGESISPYYISHWCGKRTDQIPHCNTLKGDFFCIPFGRYCGKIAGIRIIFCMNRTCIFAPRTCLINFLCNNDW